MEVYFVDIGRGTSCVILLGNNRAIVIDCGQRSNDLLHLLKRFRVQEIARLCVSHNHDDHVGGALAILTEYEGMIDRVCFLHDGLLLQTNFWRKVKQQIREGVLQVPQLVRLHCDDKPKMLYEERAKGVTLKILSPRFLDNLQAMDEGDANATSAVLMLASGSRKIVFGGDSTIRQWRRILEERKQPLACDILCVAHHGGIVWDDPSELAWLYAEGVRPRYAVVSVATSNTDKHPRQEVIRSLRSSGAQVMCTQITTRCCDSLEPLRPGALPAILPGRSKSIRDVTTSGNSRNVACAGTVVAEILNDYLTIRRFPEHQAAVDRLSVRPGGHPLCR
jgi:beta-lactamase superfamily II metal-dependent hydrolase